MELETKASYPDPEIKSAFDEFLSVFEDFKEANDERLAQLEKRAADAVTEDKVGAHRPRAHRAEARARRTDAGLGAALARRRAQSRARPRHAREEGRLRPLRPQGRRRRLSTRSK